MQFRRLHTVTKIITISATEGGVSRPLKKKTFGRPKMTTQLKCLIYTSFVVVVAAAGAAAVVV